MVISTQEEVYSQSKNWKGKDFEIKKLAFPLKFLIFSAFSIYVIADTSDETLENKKLYWPIKQSLLFS